MMGKVERKNIKLIKITNTSVVYKCGSDIITAPLTPQAKDILQWYYKKIPAND